MSVFDSALDLAAAFAADIAQRIGDVARGQTVFPSGPVNVEPYTPPERPPAPLNARCPSCGEPVGPRGHLGPMWEVTDAELACLAKAAGR